MKRFFYIMHRGWTFETDYRMEIARIIFIHAIFITFGRIVLPLKDSYYFVFYIIFGILFCAFWFFTSRSLLRFMDIGNNRRFSKRVNKMQMDLVLDYYSNKMIYCKVNGKYKRIKSKSDTKDGDLILVITIGKKNVVNYQRINRIIKENTDSNIDDDISE